MEILLAGIGVEPQIVGGAVEDHGHPVVDRGHQRVGGGGEDRAGLDAPGIASPPVPHAGKGERAAVPHLHEVGVAGAADAPPFVEAVRGDEAPPLPEGLAERRLARDRLRARVDQAIPDRRVLGKRRHQPPAQEPGAADAVRLPADGHDVLGGRDVVAWGEVGRLGDAELLHPVLFRLQLEPAAHPGLHRNRRHDRCTAPSGPHDGRRASGGFMKVLVTGGTGVVGEGAIAALLQRGHEVRILSRFGDRGVRRWPRGVEARAGDVASRGRSQRQRPRLRRHRPHRRDRGGDAARPHLRQGERPRDPPRGRRGGARRRPPPRLRLRARGGDGPAPSTSSPSGARSRSSAAARGRG